MKCPNDGKTEMTKHDDFLDMCPHCGAEKFATERCVRGMMKDQQYDWTLPSDEFMRKYDGGDAFNGLLAIAYERRNK